MTCPTVSQPVAVKRRHWEVKSVEPEHLTRKKIESHQKHLWWSKKNIFGKNWIAVFSFLVSIQTFCCLQLLLPLAFWLSLIIINVDYHHWVQDIICLSSPGKNKANPQQVSDSDLGAGLDSHWAKTLELIYAVQNIPPKNQLCILGGGFKYSLCSPLPTKRWSNFTNVQMGRSQQLQYIMFIHFPNEPAASWVCFWFRLLQLAFLWSEYCQYGFICQCLQIVFAAFFLGERIPKNADQ